MSRFGAGLDWAETATTDNLAGDGLLAPCQRERFSDPDGVTALARTWEGSDDPRGHARTVGKGERASAPASAGSAAWSRPPSRWSRCPATPRQAARGFETASLWFAGCTDPRTQLLVHPHGQARRRRGPHLPAALVGQQPATITVATARTGSLVVTTRRPQPGPRRSATRPSSPASPPPSTASAGPTAPATCAGRARARTTAPLDIGTPPGSAVGRRPAARRRRPRPVGRHRPRAGAQQLRRHPLRPHHLPGQGHQRGR